jgi:hypothetical protein
MLGVWGTAYEHAVYTAPPTHTAAIWTGVVTLFVVAGVGVAACIGVLLGE